MTIPNYFRKCLIAAGCIVALASCNPKQSTPCLNPSCFEIQRGVNLSHWLSQDFGWVPKYSLIQENDIRFIDSIGYDHVRIPIDEPELWDTLGKPIEVAFTHLENCLGWCERYGLCAIVDLHIVRAHHFNASNDGTSNTLWEDSLAQNHFVNLWVQLSDRLHKWPVNRVAYEILNEAVAPDHEDWNKLLHKAYNAIRELEPERVLVFGANMWQNASNLKYLNLPEGDKNIILSFHTYAPLAFTHYKANWTPIRFYTGPVHYPGQIISDSDYAQYVDTTHTNLVNHLADAREIYNKERLIQVFRDGLDVAKSKQLQLYCGEFGCLPWVDRNERLQYYGDIVSALEENNVAWCNWEYKGDFGLFVFDTLTKTSGKPDVELIHVLLQHKSNP